MLQKIIIGIFIITLCLQGCIIQQVRKSKQSRKTPPFQQVDFQSLVKLYMKKEKFNSVEGIYSVSGSVSKKGKVFLGNSEKEKTTDRKENYAKVAILRDQQGTGREYIELSLDKDDQTSYSIVGEFSTAAGGNILVYKHLEPKGKSTSFTFTTDKNSDILEGIRVENEGNATVTYKLTYVKLSSQ